EHGMYSVLSPEGFASILWRDSSRVAEAASLMKMTAKDLLENQVIDRMFPEPAEGLENNLSDTANEIKTALLETIPKLQAMEMSELLEKRYQRFRKFGEFTEGSNV
ncbi:MAG: acetyl-CoA carboxylase carboxyl transferase subunit alpha, partial [Clostridiaceae bacterium]|nr:acetyl-CoA carboxylase carboxyl transferase subunit alpha [Clostridiaceae bacterium]